MATLMPCRRVLVLVPPGVHGAPVSSAVARAVEAALPAGAGAVSVDATVAPLVHVVACEADIDTDVVLREARLADAASWLQAAVARIDSRGVDITWEAVPAPDVADWAITCVTSGRFDALVLAGDDAGMASSLRAALAVPVLAGG